MSLLLSFLMIGCATPYEVPEKLDDEEQEDQNGNQTVDTGSADDSDSHDSDSSDTDTQDTDSDDPQDTDSDDPQDTDPPLECPDGVICIDSFPYVDSNTTTGSGRREFDYYSCAPSTNESGEEIVYRVDVPKDGFLALDLVNMASGADVDVHLLSSLDADDCIDRGHWRAGALVTAGSYWVVADTWVNASGVELDGSYSLQVGLTTLENLENSGMHADVAEDALYAFDIAWEAGETDRFEYAITDFSLHSSIPRQWIVDLADGSLLWNLHLAHGENTSSTSDAGYASQFSNINNSHQSSLGMMRAAESYSGSFGYSMRLDGLEPGYNDLVRSRAIVVHGWEGSRPEYVSAYGMVAPTWGCPAVDDRDVADVVDTLSDGALMFFWYPDGDWSQNSTYLP